jgi:hypothetical protein
LGTFDVESSHGDAPAFAPGHPARFGGMPSGVSGGLDPGSRHERQQPGTQAARQNAVKAAFAVARGAMNVSI